MSRKCEACHKEVGFRMKECDESGLIWHCVCFTCCKCRAMLNEKDFNLRNNNKLYCRSHVIYEPGFQPVCKCFGMYQAYRVLF